MVYAVHSIESKRVGDTNYWAIDYAADNLTHLVENRTDSAVMRLLTLFILYLNVVVSATIVFYFL